MRVLFYFLFILLDVFFNFEDFDYIGCGYRVGFFRFEILVVVNIFVVFSYINTVVLIIFLY